VAVASAGPYASLHLAPERQPLQTDNHASTPPLSFYRPDALPANSVKALKAINRINYIYHILTLILSQFAVFTSWPKNGQQSA